MANRWKLHYILFQEDCFCSNSRGTHEFVKFGVRIMSVLWPTHFLDVAVCEFHIWGTANQTAELKGSLLCFSKNLNT